MTTAIQKKSSEEVPLVLALAEQYGVDPNEFLEIIKRTVLPKDATRSHALAFLSVAREYKLNPITREIYAFPGKGGGIQPIVGVDGWMKLINQHPDFDGMEFDDHLQGETLIAVTCKMYRKDRSRPVCVTEYMSECQRPTEPWKRWPARMLRHKAAIQAARYCFGFAGIIDPDEAERYEEVGVIDTEATQNDGVEGVSALRDRLSGPDATEDAAPEPQQLEDEILDAAFDNEEPEPDEDVSRETEEPETDYEPPAAPDPSEGMTRKMLFDQLRNVVSRRGLDRYEVIGIASGIAGRAIASTNQLKNEELTTLLQQLAGSGATDPSQPSML